jgi:hypothetical protein
MVFSAFRKTQWVWSVTIGVFCVFSGCTSNLPKTITPLAHILGKEEAFAIATRYVKEQVYYHDFYYDGNSWYDEGTHSWKFRFEQYPPNPQRQGFDHGTILIAVDERSGTVTVNVAMARDLGRWGGGLV